MLGVLEECVACSKAEISRWQLVAALWMQGFKAHSFPRGNCFNFFQIKIKF